MLKVLFMLACNHIHAYPQTLNLSNYMQTPTATPMSDFKFSLQQLTQTTLEFTNFPREHLVNHSVNLFPPVKISTNKTNYNLVRWWAQSFKVVSKIIPLFLPRSRRAFQIYEPELDLLFAYWPHDSFAFMSSCCLLWTLFSVPKFPFHRLIVSLTKKVHNHDLRFR